MFKNVLNHFVIRILQITLFIAPFCIILFINRNTLLLLDNPSWGDMIAMPSDQIPLSYLFHPWQNVFVGLFGGQYIPHFLSSQFSSFISSTILQFFYLFFIFLILSISFLDIFKILLRKTSFFDTEVIAYASSITLIIYFSNVFLVNFIQGNPDIYYPYFIGIPAIFYLYFVVKNKDLFSVVKLSLLITLSTWMGIFSVYYLGLLLFPFFIFFLLLFFQKEKVKVFLLLIILVTFVVVNNLPYIFATLKPIISAVTNVYGSNSPQKQIIDESFVLYRGIDTLNLFYFAGNAGDFSWLLFNIPGGFLYKSNVFYRLLSLQIVFVLITLVFSLRNNDIQKESTLLLYGCFAICLIFFTLLLIWDTPLFVSIARDIPLTPLFRNPKKLILSLFVAYIVLLIFLRLYSTKKVYGFLLAGVLALNILSVAPFISDGYNGLKNGYRITLTTYHRDTEQALNAFFDVFSFPRRFTELKEKLNSLENNKSYYNNFSYRIIVLPDNSQATYQSHLRYILNPFFVNPMLGVWGDLSSPENIMNTLYESILDPKQSNLNTILKIANVKYLIIDKKSPYYVYSKERKPHTLSYYGIFTNGEPEAFKKLLDNKIGLELISEDNNFYIYKNVYYVNSTVYIPKKICTYQQFIKMKESCDLISEDHDKAKILAENVVITDMNYINPSHYTFSLETGSSGEVTVFFNQLFDPFWYLTSEDGKNITVKNHRTGNGFGNMWTIAVPEKGRYNFSIFYSLQPIFSKFVMLSFVGIFVNIVFLFYLSFLHKKREETRI